MVNKRALIEQLQEFETGLVAQSLMLLGYATPERCYMGYDIKLMTQAPQPTVGVAMTMQIDSNTPGNSADSEALRKSFEQIERSTVPVILVVKSIGSRPQHACLCGDGMAKTLRALGGVGFITDGGVRDIGALDRLGYAVYAAGRVVHHTNFRCCGLGDPVEISGATVNTGDLIHADGDGVLIIPEEYQSGLVEACILSRDYETRAHTYGRRSDKTIKEKHDVCEQIMARISKRAEEILQGRGDPLYV